MILNPGTKVRILTLVGATFERDWSETGRVVRNHPSWRWAKEPPPAGYQTVRYDSDGARLMIHRDQLMVVNDQAAVREG